MIWRILAHAFAGGRQYLTIQLGYLKLHVFIDIWGAKMTFFDNFLRYDIVHYKDFCDTASWLLRVARLQIFFQVDINECLFGLIGAFTDKLTDCDWSTYYINHPLVNWKIYGKEWGDKYWNVDCEDEVPSYDA